MDVPYSQFLRARRISNTDVSFNLHSEALRTRFLVKGYDQRILGDCLHKVNDIDRKSLLKLRMVSQKMSWLVCHHIS